MGHELVHLPGRGTTDTPQGHRTAAPARDAGRRALGRVGRGPALPPRGDCAPVGGLRLPPLPAPGPVLLRVLEGAVVDDPAPTLHPLAHRWAATCWPDDSEPEGWGRALWWPSPQHRGWLPVALGYADVVMFAADVPTRGRWRRWWTPVRWYGVALQDRPLGLLVHGPYPDAGAAKAVADELRAEVAYHYAAPRRSR